ncbi:MAG: hypothetical protein Q4B42_01680, partial [Oscillospiraceae bacterium]|nr:hypothetical protein [Oscillospiraceae bacterium]
KRRLTHPRQLMNYRSFLRDGGKVFFKSDDEPLVEASMRYFEYCGFKINRSLRDIYAGSPPRGELTEHERMFTAEGRKIFLIEAEKLPAALCPNLPMEGVSRDIDELLKNT